MTEIDNQKSKRQLNFEVLRILAMLMIVCLHYLSKGGILGKGADADMTANSYIAWLIEAFCLVSANVYVLISGYFGVGRTDIRRAFKIWKQVLFYSITIGVIAMLAGYQSFDIYQVFNYIFPTVTEHYWFATSYILLCLFMPFLNYGIDLMDRKQIIYILGVMLILFSVAKTIIPMQLPWDKSGYDVLWFVALYLTGGCIRKYGIRILSKRFVPIFAYMASVLIIYLSFIVIRFIYFRTGKLEDFISYGYSYNYLFCYTGAVGLFMAFDRLGVQALERYRKLIITLSGATFGVYLIHEHINVRHLWPTWFDTQSVATMSTPMFLLCMTVTVLTVYLSCSLIEIIRQLLARLISDKIFVAKKGGNK